MLVVVLSCIPLGGAAGVDGAQHQQCHKGWGIRGRGLTCDPQAQSFLWKWHSALLGTALSKFSILFSGLGAPHWLGKQCWMCHCTGCLMCWAGSRWCRAQGNRAVLSGWQPPEHSGLSAWEVTARAWCWRADEKEETGGITELVPGAHSSHNNDVTHPLSALCCWWKGGIRVGSTGMEGEQRELSGDHSPHQGRGKASVAVFLY